MQSDTAAQLGSAEKLDRQAAGEHLTVPFPGAESPALPLLDALLMYDPNTAKMPASWLPGNSLI